jgi:serine/threonine protein phosphatase PrpC
MLLRAGVASDRGLIRPANEDSFFLRRGLYAVCDGMGGARAGEVASEMACMGLVALDPASAGRKELRTAIVNTNQAIVSRSLAEDHLLGMGTTLTAAVVNEGSLILAHVGDSRAYLFREGELVQLTDDHSWVGEMVRRGELTAEQAAVHPHRSVITRALGTDREVDPDVKEISVSEGDRILLCSDGLTGMVSDEQIAALLAQGEVPQAAAESLVKAALAGGGEDNVTVVVVDIMPEEASGAGEDDSDGILVGPSDRGQLSGLSLHRGRRAGAAVRERFSRRTTPVLRPVGSRQGGGVETAETSLSAPESSADGDAQGTEESAGPDTAMTIQGPAPAARIPLAAEAAAGKPPARGRTRRRWFYLVVAILLILAIAIAGFAAYNSTVYYVGKYDDGSVALFRGLPGGFLGLELSSVVELAGVKYDSLAPYMQGRVDAHDLVGKEEGRAFLKALDAQQ